MAALPAPVQGDRTDWQDRWEAKHFQAEVNRSYQKLHIPTGQKSLCRVRVQDRVEFLAFLNRKNAEQPGLWQYWAV